MSGADHVFVYTTLPDQNSALDIGRLVVERRLAACVNIYPQMISVYEWEGHIDQEHEVGMFIKTRGDLAGELMEVVKQRHPYDIPALLVLPLVGGNAEFLAWMDKQTEK